MELDIADVLKNLLLLFYGHQSEKNENDNDVAEFQTIPSLETATDFNMRRFDLEQKTRRSVWKSVRTGNW